MPVAAGPFEDAVEAHSRGDDQKALRLVRPLANDGNAVAQFHLGLMYATGQLPQHYGFGRLQTKATPLPSFYPGTNTQTAKAYCRTIVRR